MGKGMQSILKFPFNTWDKKVSRFAGLEPKSAHSPQYCKNAFSKVMVYVQWIQIKCKLTIGIIHGGGVELITKSLWVWNL